MLSGLVAFLPSLQLHQEPKESVLPSPVVDEPEVAQEVTDVQPQVDSMPGTKILKKPKKEKIVNETFIFVRPPPKMSNHPLNLQVQLVPPTSRGDRVISNPQSVDNVPSSPNDQQQNGSNDLTRTTSIRSTEGSMYSGYTSNTSISSYASQASSGSSRRIIPLYNLQAHNVMTNTIVDAGTDAKVAKFQKRGLEVIGLAILEPVEVWGNATAVVSASARTSIDGGNGSSISHRDQESAPTPSNISDRPASVSSSGGHRFRPLNILVKNTPDPALLSPNGPPPSAAKKMFGRIFKKTPSRPPSISLPPDFDTMGASSPRSSFSLPSSRLSKNITSNIIPPANSTALPSALHSAIETPTTSNGVRPLVLGVQPSMSSSISPPQGRPSKYVWIVRRWLKSTEGGLLGGMMGKLSVSGKDALGLNIGMAGVIGQVDVQFEWTRGKTGRKRDKDKRGRPSTSAGGPTNNNESHSRRASMILSSQSSKEQLRASMSRADKDKRMSTVSQRSISTHTGTSDEHVSTVNHQEDDGDESDPEDSETPWTCSISVQRVSQPSSARSPTARTISSSLSPEQDPQPVRLKVATLSPTPHHPKVVSMLKVPFPLPDIEVEKMAVQPRVITAQGLARPGISIGHEGLILTAEEIKDVVSCTGLWLVVREGFGGVGKVNRKGDGWKIRG